MTTRAISWRYQDLAMKLKLFVASVLKASSVQAPLAKITAHPHFKELRSRLKAHIVGDRLWPRQLANTLWALGKMGLDDEDFINPLFDQMEKARHAWLNLQEADRSVRALACLTLTR